MAAPDRVAPARRVCFSGPQVWSLVWLAARVGLMLGVALLILRDLHAPTWTLAIAGTMGTTFVAMSVAAEYPRRSAAAPVRALPVRRTVPARGLAVAMAALSLLGAAWSGGGVRSMPTVPVRAPAAVRIIGHDQPALRTAAAPQHEAMRVRLRAQIASLIGEIARTKLDAEMAEREQQA